MNNFEVTIGIENHVELLTKSKMFSSAPVSYAQIPNTMVNNMDMGYPGVLPTINQKGVELALLACQAFHMSVDALLRFDRKNYYYPDLPKGFQITQQFFPIGKDGWLEIENNNSKKRINIERLHIEEDTAKQIHKDGQTYLDFNRAGIGLIEIVSQPEMHSAQEAVKYVEKLREIILYAKISDAKMSEGSLRCDINISLSPIGAKTLGTKVELKNLNSLANIEKAVEYEIQRQQEILMQGKIVLQETRRFDEKTKTTIMMRSKSDAIDYNYFPEPNLAPIQLSELWINEIKRNLPELAHEKRQRYAKEYHLKTEEINILLQNYNLMTFFEKAVIKTKEYGTLISYLLGDISAYLNQKNLTIVETQLQPDDLAKLISLVENKIISTKQAKQVLLILLKENVDPEEVIKKYGMKQLNDEQEISVLILPVIDQHQEMLNQFENRPERVLKFFMGELMKLTKGQVNPEIGQQIVLKIIKSKL